MITMQTFARECFQRSTESMMKTFAAVPDDKLGWRPSDTARSSLELVSHVGFSNKVLAAMIAEKPGPFKDASEFLTGIRVQEKSLKTREQVLALIEDATPLVIAAIDGVKDDKIEGTIETIFGPHPLRKVIFFPDWHLSAHSAQLEYLQTIWGDLEMHG